jgi:predicted MFS family arabinose efflux permease
MGTHALATLPAGWLGDRLDRRRLLAAAVLLWSAGALAAALAGDFATLAVSRALTGLATACVVPVANTIIAETFAPVRKASVLAVFNVGLFVGGMGGAALGATPGYPTALFALAAPGVIVALLLVRLDVPPRVSGTHVPGFAATLVEARELLAIPTLRWVMLSTTLMAFAAGGYQTWLLDFLKHDKGLDEDPAIQLLAISFIGGLAGVIVGGRVGDVLRRRWVHGRLAAIVIGMGCTVPCAIGAIYAPQGPLLVITAIGTMFFISWYHGPMAASVDDLAPEGRAVSTQALVIFSMHLLGTAPASWVVGEIKEAYDFRVAMLVPTAIVGAAALVMTRAFAGFDRDARGSTRAGRGAITDRDG